MKFLISLIAIIVLFSSSLSAACIGRIPVIGTDDTRATCADKTADRPVQQINDGVGSGEKNINVILDPLLGRSRPDEETTSRNMKFEKARHAVRLELMPYVLPGDSRFSEPGMPEQTLPNGIAYEYAFSKGLTFGFVFQEFTKTGGKSFDPVSYTDSSGDVHIIGSPGAMQTLKYRMYMPYAAFNMQISNLYDIGLRVGVGRVEGHPEYDERAIRGGSQYIDNTSMLIDLFIERWLEFMGGIQAGGALRYINGANDTSNYLETTNLSTAQAVLYLRFHLPGFGVVK